MLSTFEGIERNQLCISISCWINNAHGKFWDVERPIHFIVYNVDDTELNFINIHSKKLERVFFDDVIWKSSAWKYCTRCSVFSRNLQKLVNYYRFYFHYSPKKANSFVRQMTIVIRQIYAYTMQIPILMRVMFHHKCSLGTVHKLRK